MQSPVLSVDSWLSKQLGLVAYNVLGPARCIVASDIPPSGAFISAKVKSDQQVDLDHLQALGFRVITVNVLLFCKALSAPCAVDNTRARFASSADESAIRKIARESFSHDRFHADRKIQGSTADAIKEQWVTNYFHGQRGDALFVVEHATLVVGFLLAIDSKKSGFIIDLIAIDKAFQGRGLARSLIAFAYDFFSNKNSAVGITVGTQVSNTQSLRLYQKSGFEVASTNYMLHLHRT
jgi:ribosomal protein S18 acetylase RimI-like enzyme